MNFKYKEDTIAAIATPAGIGAISIIRVSGNKALNILKNNFISNKKIEDVDSHTIIYGKIKDNSNNIIDDVLISVFKKPKSYTGEDTIEISTHGSPFIQKQILKLLLENGARIAKPGEFTERAFLNGKMDLTQAEAVIDIINSRTEVSLRGARNQFNGELSKKIQYFRDSLTNLLSLLELELDFVEEDLQFVPYNDLILKCQEVINEIDKLLLTYRFGKIVKDGVNVAIIGKPNVGKSSLLNLLAKDSIAIVSDIPGTTRDIIKEEISINGILYKFFDTAGIRETNNLIEAEGIKRTIKAIHNADIILFLSDDDNFNLSEIHPELDENDLSKKIIKVRNKADLIKEKIDNPSNFSEIIYISVIEQFGIDNLLEILNKTTLDSNIYTEETAIITSERHYQALVRSKENLLKAIDSMKNNFSGEYIAIDLRLALDSMSEIIGVITSEDILNNIFSKFCIGK